MDSYNQIIRASNVMDECMNYLLYNTMLEDGEASEESKPNPADRSKEIVNNKTYDNAWRTFWNNVLKFITDKLNKLKVKAKENKTLPNKLVISKMAWEGNIAEFQAIAAKAAEAVQSNNQNRITEVTKSLRAFETDFQITVEIAAGTKPNYQRLYGDLRVLSGISRRMLSVHTLHFATEGKECLNSVRKNAKEWIKTIRTILNSVEEKPISDDKNNEGGKETVTESIMNSRLSNSEKAAMLLQEAAYMLLEDGAGQDDVQRDDTAVQEFDDLPEEHAVEQDEYDTSVVGGDDEDPDLEEIKDLVGDDSDVIDILTEDEDSAIIDADGDVNNESAIFSLDW